MKVDKYENGTTKTLFNVGKFRFEKKEVNKWMDVGGNIEYHYETRKTGIIPLNQHEGLLTFEFRLEITPIGEIKFQGDCILFSPILKDLIIILKSKKDSKIRRRNEIFMNALNKLLLKRCLNYAKELGEEEGIQFHNFEFLLSQLGLENISFKNEEKKILTLEGDQLIPKKEINNKKPKIKNFAGFKEFIFYDEKVIPEKNSGKSLDNAHFDVNSKLNNLKILSKKSLLIQFHFTMKISPEIAFIEFDGQFIMDSFLNEVGYLVRYQKAKLLNIFQKLIAKAGIKHAEIIGKKYRIGFDSDIVCKKLGLK